jgi:hypothetical protein
VRQGLWWGGLGLLLFLAACGNGNKDSDKAQEAAATSQSTPTTTATPASLPAVAGDPPASPETKRIEALLAGATLPSNIGVFGRRDIPNEAVEKDSPEAARRFRENVRVTGNYYVLSVDGAQRMTLSINLYGSPEGAGKEFDFGKGNPAPDDRIEAEGIGQNRSALRSTIGEGASTTSLYVISFTRGCYYVVVADFPPGGADSPPDSALALAQAVDDQLKASPSGAGGGVGCG